MKRFIVILVIVLISIPLIYVVYGLTNNINSKSIDRVSNSKIVKPLLKTISSSSDGSPAAHNPFEDAMPIGVKGKVAYIDTDNMIIKLSEVKYFNPSTGLTEKVDFQVYYTVNTLFIKDLVKNAKVEDIKSGDEIICEGENDFENKVVRNANRILTGSFLPEGLQLTLAAVGQIGNLDRENKSFTIDLSNTYDGLSEVTVLINESTECYARKTKDGNDIITKITNGFIPDSVKNGTLVSLEIRIKQNDTNAYADKAYFFESSAD